VLDAECQQALKDMTGELLSAKSAAAEFSVLWRNDEGVSARTHRDYLDELAWTAGTWLQEAVDAGVARMAETWSSMDSVRSQLLGEITEHWLTARDRVRWFTGQNDAVNLVQSYVLSDDDKPLVLHGSPGVGKSSIIAKVAAEVFAKKVIVFNGVCLFVSRNTQKNYVSVATSGRHVKTHTHKTSTDTERFLPWPVRHLSTEFCENSWSSFPVMLLQTN